MPRKPHIKDNLACFLMLIFEEHLEVITTKINKAIGPLREIGKNFAKTVVKNYVQSFCEATSRL